jgi:protein-disulfide isomerase
MSACGALFRDPNSPAVGNRDSGVHIVAFLDYRCPYCKKLTNILAKMQVDNVRIVYKEWPILGDSSLLAARAALAADKQGKYLAFHRRLMNSRLIPTATYIEEIAVTLGLNQSQLRTDMNSARHHACNPAHICAGIGTGFTWDTSACCGAHDCSR